MRQINDGSGAGMMNPIVILSTPCGVCETPAGEVCRRECGCGDRLDTFMGSGTYEDRLAMHIHTEQFMEERYPQHYDPNDSLTLSPRELEALKKMIKNGTGPDPEKFTFFWRKESPFSQWYPCTFTVGHVTFNCAEQYMMAEKARIFRDEERLGLIMATDEPDLQKRLGRQVKGFDEDEWNRIVRDIVYHGNHAKFSQNPELKQALLDTSGTIMAEASPRDKIWGIGMKETDPNATNRNVWNGTNWLGEVLMRVRVALLTEVP